MARLSQFASNAGGVGCVQCILVSVMLFFFLRADVRNGIGHLTVPLVFVCFFVAYLSRDKLVDNVALVRVAMNSCLVVAVIATFALRDHVILPSPWDRIAGASSLSLYMGCYFWLLSDQRIIIR